MASVLETGVSSDYLKAIMGTWQLLPDNQDLAFKRSKTRTFNAQ